MNWIIMGCAAFILLTVFDMNKIHKWHSSLNVLFTISLLFLMIATSMLLLNQKEMGTFQSNYWYFILVVLGAVEQLYALFYALPMNETYNTLHSLSVVDKGIYGLCRHPGVWGFVLMAVGLSLGTGSIVISIAATIWTLFDLIHVWIQDSIIFPRSIRGYHEYQNKVPFLFLKIWGYK